MELRWLMQSALTNAAMVVLLAGVAVFVGRCLRRPALTHALWVLVLVKFVTPPLVAVPVPGEWLPDSLTGLTRTYLVSDEAPVQQRPEASRRGGTGDPGLASAEGALVLTPGPAHIPAGKNHTLPASAERDSVRRALMLLWLAGTCVYFMTIAARIVQFSLRLRTGAAGVPEADARAGEIGLGLGLRSIPGITFAAQPCSPVLWGLGRFTRIVFPTVLWNQLSPPCRDALLTHELAHYRRRDHWVRPLEIVVTGLFWWHPVVWWARRNIEAAEEACCDAWVVRQSPVSPRTYAEALLATVDYIASDSPSTVPAATGIGGAPDLQHRLRRIMRRCDSPLLPDSGRGLLCAAGLLLPLHPFVVPPVNAATLTPRAPDGAGFVTSPDVIDDSPSPPPRRGDLDSRDNGTMPPGWWTGLPQDRWALVESPDARFRLLAVAGNRVFLEDRRTGRRTDLSSEQVTVAAFVPDSRHFVTGSVDGTVRLWEAVSGEALSLLGPHDAEVVAVAVAPSGQFAASGSRDGAVLVWDLGSGVVRSTWTDSSRSIVSIRIASNDRTLAVASGDWRSGDPARITLLALDSGTVEPLGFLSLPDAVAAIEFAAGDKALLAAAWDGTVVRWDLISGTSSPAGEVDRSVVNAATFSPDVRFADRIRTPPPPDPYVPDWAQIGNGPLLFPEPQMIRGQAVLPFGDTPFDRDPAVPDEFR